MKPLFKWYFIVGGATFVFLWFSLFILGFLKVPELDALKVVFQQTNEKMHSRADAGKVNWTNVDLRSRPIPEEFLNRTKDVTIENGRVEVKNIKVFFRKAKPLEGFPVSGQSLLFLHGQSFNSYTWAKLGTLNLMAVLGHVAVAVDLPGYGMTKQKYNGDRADFILSFMKKVSLDSAKPVLISPSMSGQYSVAFVTKYSDHLSGYIPVAPVATGTAAKDRLKQIQLPTLILYGENDYTKLAEEALKNLRIMPNSREVRLENARHAAYMDQPEVFHQILYNYMELLKNT